jgi:hypothetical protein
MPLRKITEALAAISVVLGLLFVGIEIRNNTAVAIAETRREATAQNVDFLMQIAQDDALNELWSREWTIEFVDSLSRADYNKVEYSAIALILRLETVYLQAQQGLLEESAFATYGLRQPKLAEPWFEELWTQRFRSIVDPSFAEYFDHINGYPQAGS